MKAKKVFSLLWKDILKPLLILPILLWKIVRAILHMIYEKIISKLRFSITFRITFMYANIITLILLLLSGGILGGGFAFVIKNEGDELRKELKQIAAYIQPDNQIQQQEIRKLSELYGTTVSIFDANKKLVFTTEKNSSAAIFIDQDINRKIVIERDEEDLILISYSQSEPINIPREIFNDYGFALVLNDNIGEKADLLYVQIIDKLAGETVYAGIFVITLAILDIVFLIAIIIIGHSASKKLLKPIRVMTDAVQNVTLNQMDGRLDVRGSQNEFRDLARTFNSMLDRLQSSYEMQNRFVSDASHELRTPISVIQGYANLLDRWGKDDRQVLEEAIDAIKTEAEDMKGLIEKLLFLARGDKDTQKIEKTSFDVKELIEDIIKETKLITAAHDIIEGRNESFELVADRSLLKEAIRVFVDNSVKFTAEGGKIQLQSYMLDNAAVITIEDTGAGIAKEDLPHVFERFYRADKSRTKNTGGTGLGMAIAHWIITKHAGTIKVQSELNVGTKITILLPKNIKN